MEYSIEINSLENLKTDCIIVGVFEGNDLSPSAEFLNSTQKNFISQSFDYAELTGKLGESLLVNWSSDNLMSRFLLIGLGKKNELTDKNYRIALSTAAKVIKEANLKSAACTFPELEIKDRDYQWKTRQVIEVFDDFLYQFNQCKSKIDNALKTEKISIVVDASYERDAETGLRQGLAIASAVAMAKQMADLPGNICTPAYLSDQALKLADIHAKISVEILEESDMEKLGMGALLSVSRGSRQPAKLIAINYQGGEKNRKPIVFIGKGLTFDAGGISLKPGLGMDEMKYDMCGGAAVISACHAAAELDLPLNLIGLIPASENLPDGNANKPGDILTSMSGQTIEVLNTDAEGRLILCDTLTYAKKYDPEVVIDMATLTGACLVALGRIPSGLLGNDDALCNDLIEASYIANDSLWRLPLWEEYQELLKSNFADMANIGGKDAGTITAACFLSRFAEDFRWAHLDIAGTAWRTGQNKGATGRPVPLLVQYLLNRTTE